MPRPSLPHAVLGVATLLLAVSAVLFYSSPDAATARQVEREREAAARSVDAPPETARAVPGVESLVLREATGGVAVEVSGVLEAVRAVTLSAEVAGQVVEIAAVEHSDVEAGALLVRLDPDLAAAASESARAALARARATSRLARAEFARQRELMESGVGSQADFDRRESESRAASAQVAEAEARLREAETRLSKTRLTAPFAGVVGRIDLEPGAYLNPGDPVTRIVDLSELEMEIGVTDRQILTLELGAAVRVEVDALPGESFSGRIAALGRSPDAQTRKYPVPVRVQNPDARLLPGMLGAARFQLGAEKTAVRVPRRAVVREFDLEYVFALEPVANSTELATARRVRVRTSPVPFHPELLELSSSLEPGARIAVSGVRDLRDDQRVRLQLERSQQRAGTGT